MLVSIVAALAFIYIALDWLLRQLKVGQYDKKYVLITGCDTGFGRDLAIRLDSLGFNVFAACLTEKGQKSLSMGSSRLRTLPMDVTDQDSIQQAEKFVRERLPDETALWAIVNNAGVTGQIAPLEMCTRQEMVDACQVNLFGPVEVTRVFLPLLRQSRGRIVSAGSVMGRFAAAPVPYCASKYGMEAVHDILRRDMAQFGIKVSLLEPGYHRTPILDVDAMVDKLKQAYSRASEDVQKAYGGSSFMSKMKALIHSATEHSSHDTYKVIDAYVDALTSRYPRPRYVVGWDAKLFFVPLSLVPDWFSDSLTAWLQKFVLREHGFDS